MSIPDDTTTEAELQRFAKAERCTICGHSRKSHSEGSCSNCSCKGNFTT